MEGPLQGIRVLDLTQALAGPFGAMILGDLGAEVIKVESPTGDLTRTTPPHYVEGTSVYFLSINRNKKGVAINLKDDDGRAVFYDMVRQSDVVFYNYSPGVAGRLQIDHDTLISVNPEIITCNVTGFGRRGPEADRRAVDLIVQAMAGGMSITGEPGRPPVRAGVPTGDLSCGLFAALGILAGVIERGRTGEGLEVEATLFHSQLSLLTYVAAYCLFSGDIPPPMGSGHLGTVPSQVFATQDSYIVVDAGFDKFFRQLCAVLDLSGLADDPRFADRQSRSDNREELIPQLEARFRQETTGHWIEELEAHGVPCGPVNNVEEALRAEQTREYDMVKNVPYKGKQIEALGTPLWFDTGASQPLEAPPDFAEDTEAVLRDLLGYGRTHIEELAEAGAIITEQ